MVRTLFPILLLCACLALLPTQARTASKAGMIADEDDEGELTFCSFGPKIKVVDPVVVDQLRTPPTGDKCSGSAKIQGVQWACLPPGQTTSKIEEFRKRLLNSAEDECKRLCHERGSGCEALFEKPTHAGFETDGYTAGYLGKREQFGCRKDCAGQSFVYASVYDAGFRTEDPKQLAGKPPNCRCLRNDD